MKRSPPLIIAVAALLIFGGPAANAKDGWTRVQTRNFTLVGNANENDIRKIAIKLETFRETLSLMFPRARIATAVPTTVVIFRSDGAFRPFKPRYQGKIRDDVGGYFLPGSYMNYIVLSADRDLVSPYEIIFHEYEHFVLRNNLRDVPLWLDEGLAEFYSTFETTNGDLGVKVGMPLAKHILYLRAHPLLPLKTLLEVNRKSPQYNESSKAGAFYAESWALVHYLMNGNDQKRQPQLLNFINLVGSGVSSEESFHRAFGANFKTIEKELTEYVNSFNFPYLNGTFRSQLAFDKGMESVPLSEAEVQYYEGDLLLSLRQLSEAGVLLEKSVTLDDQYARSLVSLGTLRLIQDRSADAKELFQSAMKSDPTNFLAHYYYAEVLARAGRYDEAIRAYQQAVSLKPDLATLFTSLGFAYLKAGNEDEAIKTFEAGLRVNSRESYFYRTLSYIYLRRRNSDQASNNAYSYLRTEGWRDEHSQYMLLVWYFSLRQAKHDEFAGKTLEESMAKVDSTDWPYPVLQYIDRRLTLDELLVRATDNDKLTEAHTYAGLTLSFNGEVQGALEHLRWVRDNGNRNFVEYPLALSEIVRLEEESARAK